MSNTVLAVGLVVLWLLVVAHIMLTLAVVRRVNTFTAGLGAGSQAMEPGQAAPDFTAETLNGTTVSLGDLSDQPSLIVFMSPTCPPCRDSMPDYAHLAELAPSAGVRFLLVSDGAADPTRDVVTEFDVHCPVLVAPKDSNPFFKDWNITGTPQFVWIERGKVRSSGVTSRNLRVWTDVVRRFEESNGKAALARSRR